MVQAGPKKTIFLVEDDVFMIELFAKAAVEAGFNVENAQTGKEALEKIPLCNPDLIVLDLILPDQNGFEVLRQIRRQSGGPLRKVLILSNLYELKDIDEAKRLGAIEYLMKANTSLPEIIQKINAALAI
ncbi:MAG: response regulator receiver protein [Parcubacteria group bacterium Gr01-1014_33]|nr:MAG: response regulator receiver protein [Parcubacteria group bacterium Gr01-1014_33]